jgi:hypothetical protein
MEGKNPLTSAEITELLGGTRIRGGYLSRISTFVTEGDIYINFMEFPEYASKVAASVKNSVTQNVDKYRTTHPDAPALKCILTKDNRVILVNLDAHAADTANAGLED